MLSYVMTMHLLQSAEWSSDQDHISESGGLGKLDIFGRTVGGEVNPRSPSQSSLRAPPALSDLPPKLILIPHPKFDSGSIWWPAWNVFPTCSRRKSRVFLKECA